MRKIVIFGKGGIGKSTVSSNLAALYARRGLKVLLVGCDPKHDTTVSLTEGKPIRTVIESAAFDSRSAPAEGLVVKGALGVDCVEAGGPEPGIGCAGRGILRTIEVLGDAGLLEDGRYDAAIFDVLGDVVCGGFAAPLRKGFADRVCVVASEELMALYAANNIARAIVNHAVNGAALCGILANLRDPGADRACVERFSELIGTRVLGFLPRDPAVRAAEYSSRSVVEAAPESALARALEPVADALWSFEPARAAPPRPLADGDFMRLSREAFRGERAEPVPAARPRAAAAPAPERRPGPDGTPVEDGRALESELRGRSPRRGWNAQQWGAAEQWRTFFCDREARRNMRRRLELRAPVVHVRHQDLECSFATPPQHLPGAWCDFPWAAPLGARRERPRPPGAGPRFEAGGEAVTDLRDADVVRGGAAKLEAALEAVSKELKDVEAVVIHSTCMPTVIGDDAAGAAARKSAALPVPVFLSNAADNRVADPAKALFEKLQQGEPPPLRPNAVNLVGFPEGAARDELEALLNSCGVEVNAWGMPAMTLEAAARWRAARAQVLMPNAAFDEAYGGVFRPLATTTLELPGPYGFEGTRRWALAVAEAAGCADKARGALDAALAALEQKRAALRARTAGRRVAFVADAETVDRLVEPPLLWGVPAVEQLRELGVGVDVLFFGAPPEGPSRLLYFETREQLAERLADGRFAAVYSEYAWDERVARAGKARFSLRFFEPGLEGALRTAERFAALLGWRFHERYGRWL